MLDWHRKLWVWARKELVQIDERNWIWSLVLYVFMLPSHKFSYSKSFTNQQSSSYRQISSKKVECNCSKSAFEDAQPFIWSLQLNKKNNEEKLKKNYPRYYM